MSRQNDKKTKRQKDKNTKIQKDKKTKKYKKTKADAFSEITSWSRMPCFQNSKRRASNFRFKK